MKIKKNTISIKIFALSMIIFMFLSGGYVFYNFFNDSKATTQSLLEENIQVSLLNIKHFLDKSLQYNNINVLTAYLDDFVYSNSIIKDIHIIDNHYQLVYSTDRDTHTEHKDIECISISGIIHSDIFQQECYSFDIKLFDKLHPYYYTGHVYLNKIFLDSLLKDKIIKYATLFCIYFLSFLLIFWVVAHKFIIQPLEALRQFAASSKNVPQKFFIHELESIRFSLHSTFKRLKKEQEELYKLSTKDALSGLYNRFSLIEKLQWLISKNKRTHQKFALIFLDLDNFKNINDSKGHEFGDKVLQHVSKTLLDSVRDNDIVSRLGGDEFVIVLPEIQGESALLEVIQRIMKNLAKPMEIEDNKVHITCSLGVTLYPKDGENVTELLKNADIAMYKSKELGKNNFYFFTKNLNYELQEKLTMQKMLTNALENNYFQLYYQPKVDIQTHKIVGCEALIRLIDPQKGLIPPNKFITIAEENNFIIPLGEWIIQTATQQLKQWENTPLKDIKLSINISGTQFNDKNLIQTLKHSIKKIDKSKLDIELTESVLMNDYEEKLALIHTIKELGITLSLDDFGTGYSSLSYLKQIPFDTLKIDKSFIDDLENTQQQSFVTMIITIAKELNLNVVAEGVETEYQLRYLHNVGCQQYQGYYCSKPLPVEEFEKLFQTHLCP